MSSTNYCMTDTDFFYYLKWNTDDILNSYDGTAGYVILRPWPGGLNNIRMSLELIVCIAYLTNKSLVLPPKYNMYLLKDMFGIEDLFDIDDIKINIYSFDEFCTLKNIEPSFNNVASISHVMNTPYEKILNFEDTIPDITFTKGRAVINKDDFMTNAECVFFDGTLLGNFNQLIYSSKMTELKQLVARYVHYKKEMFDVAWNVISLLGDQQYYAMHIRRNDFQYKDLLISAEEMLTNIKDIIPKGSKLYIATDHSDKKFFTVLSEYYDLYFYEDVLSAVPNDLHYNKISIVEQLICSRAIKFIGNYCSTLSSYIFRLRGYMDDIHDKYFYVNTKPFAESDQITFADAKYYIGSWTRDFKDVWDFKS